MRVLALTHGESVGPGVMGDAVVRAGDELVEWSVPARGGAPSETADVLLVFGGAMNPDDDDRHPWLTDEKRFLARELDRGTPVFGVCLGAQLLARAAGAEARLAPEPEIGWLPVGLTPAGAADPVLGALPERFHGFLWHRYTFDLPHSAVELARSATCTQAFRLEQAWGIQFHAEITEPQIGDWMAQVPGDVADPDGLRADTRAQIGASNRLGRDLAGAFLDAVRNGT